MQLRAPKAWLFSTVRSVTVYFVVVQAAAVQTFRVCSRALKRTGAATCESLSGLTARVDAGCDNLSRAVAAADETASALRTTLAQCKADHAAEVRMLKESADGTISQVRADLKQQYAVVALQMQFSLLLIRTLMLQIGTN